MPRPVLTFARFVATAENRAALAAVYDLASGLQRPIDAQEGKHSRPLLLHGPAGAGKTHLVQALAGQVVSDRGDLVVTMLAAGDLARQEHPTLFQAEDDTTHQAAELAFEEARHCDLLIIEDLQHLTPRAAQSVAHTMDYLQSRGRPMVFTANAGPQKLAHRGQRLPARLTNRLAGGLVVALAPYGAASRLTLLQTFAQRRQLAVPTETLRWLADRLSGGGRQLEAAIARLETLARHERGPLRIAAVEAEFRDQADAGKLTMERITERVGGYFRVDPNELQSSRRSRNVLLPRQVSMYLARTLTELSLQQIGEYFGGRDHSTVLHACQKLEKALNADATLSGAVREIQAALL